MPEVSRTRATLRRAEFGFLGVVVYTRVHTPRRCGEPLRAGVATFVVLSCRPLRTSWLMVGNLISVRVVMLSAADRVSRTVLLGCRRGPPTSDDLRSVLSPALPSGPSSGPGRAPGERGRRADPALLRARHGTAVPRTLVHDTGAGRSPTNRCGRGGRPQARRSKAAAYRKGLAISGRQARSGSTWKASSHGPGEPMPCEEAGTKPKKP